MARTSWLNTSEQWNAQTDRVKDRTREVVTRHALAWLKGKSSAAAPLASQDTRHSMAVRGSALQARNIKLPSIYAEAARLEQLYYP